MGTAEQHSMGSAILLPQLVSSENFCGFRLHSMVLKYFSVALAVEITIKGHKRALKDLCFSSLNPCSFSPNLLPIYKNALE